MSIRAVLFDLDGTLLDSYGLISESFRQASRDVLSRDLTEGEVLERWGSPLRTRFEGVDPSRIDELIDAYVAYYDEHHDRLATLFPGVREMLDALKDRRCRMAVVTSKRRHTTTLAIERFGLSRYFDAVVSEQDVHAAKPAPDPVLLALRRLGEPPEAALMIGDSIIDIRAARAAGVRSVAALWGTREIDALLVEGADYMAPKPADVVTLLDTLP